MAHTLWESWRVQMVRGKAERDEACRTAAAKNCEAAVYVMQGLRCNLTTHVSFSSCCDYQATYCDC